MVDSRSVPLVTVVMPVRNEAAHLGRAFDALDGQTYPRDRVEILVVDGGSTDATAQVVSVRARVDPRIRLLGGPGVNTPMAMNVGIKAASGRYIAKVDGHGWVGEGYLGDAVEILETEPDVGCVGGEIVPVAETAVEQAIRVARFSKLGVGGGIYTAAQVRHDIDTVQCGVYRKDVLEAIGGFDPALQFGEDEEVNHRLRLAGHRIVFEPSVRFHYLVRPSLRSLFRQYFNYGRARVAVVRKHPSFLRLKHVVPSGLVLVLIASVLGTIISPAIPVLVVGGYAAALLGAGVGMSRLRGGASPLLIAAALACLHLGYGLGMLTGLVRRSGPAVATP